MDKSVRNFPQQLIWIHLIQVRGVQLDANAKPLTDLFNPKNHVIPPPTIFYVVHL
jgi:hypothetical protein